jgi:hypothetical protein
MSQTSHKQIWDDEIVSTGSVATPSQYVGGANFTFQLPYANA